MGGKYSYPQRHFETIHSFTSYTAGNYKRTRKTAALETNLSTFKIANPIFQRDNPNFSIEKR